MVQKRNTELIANYKTDSRKEERQKESERQRERWSERDRWGGGRKRIRGKF